MSKCSVCGNEYSYNELVDLGFKKYCGKCHQKIFESKQTKCETCGRNNWNWKTFKVRGRNMCESCLNDDDKRKRRCSDW